MNDSLTHDERRALEALARTVLHAAATAPDVATALTWGEDACACLRLAAAQHSLRDAGNLLDRAPSHAPFAAAWRAATAPLAARAEALHVQAIEQDVDRLTTQRNRT